MSNKRTIIDLTLDEPEVDELVYKKPAIEANVPDTEELKQVKAELEKLAAELKTVKDKANSIEKQIECAICYSLKMSNRSCSICLAMVCKDCSKGFNHCVICQTDRNQQFELLELDHRSKRMLESLGAENDVKDNAPKIPKDRRIIYVAKVVPTALRIPAPIKPAPTAPTSPAYSPTSPAYPPQIVAQNNVDNVYDLFD